MVLNRPKSKIQTKNNKLKQRGGEDASMPPEYMDLIKKIEMPPELPSPIPNAMEGGYRKKSSRKSKQNKSRKAKSNRKGKQLTKKNRKH